jgi:hypothetical protein
MALYNNLTAADIKASAVNVANEMERCMSRWKHWATVLSTMPGADLTALGLDEDMQNQIGSLRSDALALETWYQANCLFVKRFSQPLIF